MKEKLEKWEPEVSLEPLKDRKSLHDFQEEAERALKKFPGGTVAIFNMRQFKYINECYGRETGDRLLAGIISAMKQRKKDNELFYWIGGDIFYVFINRWERSYVRQRLESYNLGGTKVSEKILKNSQVSF